jgi:hypothetical protein
VNTHTHACAADLLGHNVVGGIVAAGHQIHRHRLHQLQQDIVHLLRGTFTGHRRDETGQGLTLSCSMVAALAALVLCLPRPSDSVSSVRLT